MGLKRFYGTPYALFIIFFFLFSSFIILTKKDDIKARRKDMNFPLEW